MRTLVEDFLNPLFGEMVGGVHIATMKPPICFRDAALGQAYMNAASVNGNLL